MLVAKLTEENDVHHRFSVFLDSVNIGHLCTRACDGPFLEGALCTTPSSLYCPPEIIQSLRDYERHGLPPGDFLLSVLRNDLRLAVGYADSHNQHLLRHIVGWLYNHFPAHLWGSREAVAEHFRECRERRSV